MVAADARCSNCRFYQPHDLSKQSTRHAFCVSFSECPHGECRRATPTIADASLVGSWPLVMDYEWCGEWMPGDPKAP